MSQKQIHLQKGEEQKFIRDLLAFGDRSKILRAFEDVRREASDYKAPFSEKYWSDPVGFARDCISWKDGEFLTDYQQEILDAIPKKKRVCVRACHGAGKSCLSSIAVLWMCLTRDGVTDFKVVTTAGSNRQLTKYLWPEIRKWSSRLRWSVIGRPPFNPRTELLKENLNLKTGLSFAASSDNYALIEGCHASSLFYLMDEAKSIQNEIYDAVEGAYSGAGDDTGREAFALVISTPGAPSGRFWEIQTRKPGLTDWFVYAVKLEDVIKAGRVSKEWVDARRQQWGNSSIFVNRVEGNFCESEEDTLIPSQWIEFAIERGLDQKIQS